MDALSKCPICGGELVVKEYKCLDCHSTISGEFKAEKVFKLSQKKLDFLFDYLKLRGNLKELGNKTGVSYPTIRLRFDELLDELGIKAEREAVEEEKNKISEILDAIAKGEIKAKDGMEKIKKIKGRQK